MVDVVVEDEGREGGRDGWREGERAASVSPQHHEEVGVDFAVDRVLTYSGWSGIQKNIAWSEKTTSLS